MGPWGLYRAHGRPHTRSALIRVAALHRHCHPAATTLLQVAMGDLSRIECPWLQHGVEVTPYTALPPREPSYEAEVAALPAAAAADDALASGAQEPAAAEPAVAGNTAAPAADAVASAGAGTSSRPATSSAVQPAEPAAGATASNSAAAPAAAASAAAGSDAALVNEQQPAESAEGPEQTKPSQAKGRPKRYVHAFVLVRPGRREVARPLLLDPATGLLHKLEDAPCTGVEWAYNASNFWLNLQCSSGAGGGSRSSSSLAIGSDGSAMLHLSEPGLSVPAATDWNFTNPNCWLPLLMTKEVGCLGPQPEPGHPREPSVVLLLPQQVCPARVPTHLPLAT